MDWCLKDFVHRIEVAGQNLYGVSVWQHGREIACHRWVDDAPRNVYSFSKSVTSLAIGMAIDEGILSLETTVASVFPTILAHGTERQRKLNIRHLLTMTSGHDRSYLTMGEREVLQRRDWVQYYLEQPMPHEPGSFYLYDTGNTYLMAAMLQELTGESILYYLMPRLFEPLGIAFPRWDPCPRGIPLGGGALYLTLPEMARFGQLCLQQGNWEGKQLVSAQWIREAGRKQVDNTNGENPHSDKGYGYHFACVGNQSFMAAGAYGQRALVVPHLDAVVAVQAREYKGGDETMAAIWEEIVPQLEQRLH